MPNNDADARLFTLASAAGKRVIVALAVGQALLLLLVHEAILQEWPPFGSITFRTVYLTLVAAIPTALHLLLDDPRERRPWWYALGMAVVMLPLAWYAGSQCAPEHGVESAPVLVPFGLSMGVAWFVSLAFLQAARIGRHRDYDVLFEAAWHHLLSLALTAGFVGAFWLLLLLWAALFDVIGVSFFEDLFTDRRFIYAATGLMGGIGLVLVRGFAGAVVAVRGVLLTLVRALLPLGAFIALLFLAALPFTGLQPLWDTGRAAALMMALTGVLLAFLNGVFQTGTKQPPYPAGVRRVVEAAFVVLPAYPVLSGYALALRVGQYGWTQSRFWAALLIGVLAAYALTYAAAVFLGSRDDWMGTVRPANRTLALALIVLLVLVNTPLLDPLRFAVADQVDRLRSATKQADAWTDDLRYLRFETGERGYRALQQLQREDAFSAQPRLAARLDSVLVADRSRPFRPERAGSDQLRQALAVVPDTAAPPTALYETLRKAPIARSCQQRSAQCVLLAVDLRNGPPREYVLFTDHGTFVQAYVFAPADSTWERVGQLETLRATRADSVMRALREGRIRTAPSRWQDLVIGGERLERRSGFEGGE